MVEFGQALREAARKLDLSDAEVARRAGLDARRYSHYVLGDREPGLATLITICRVLNTSPNALLGFAGEVDVHSTGDGAPDERQALLARLVALAAVIEVGDLRIALGQIEVLAKGRRGG